MRIVKNPDYPRGKLNLSDEGALTVAFAVQDGTVLLHFGKPVKWIGLGAVDARAWAARLLELADRIEQ